VRKSTTSYSDWLELVRQRNLGLIFTARLSMSVSRAIAGVAVPLYLASLGFSAFELGILFLTIALFSAALSSLIGLTTNRFGARTFMVAVPALVAISGLVYAYSHDTALLFIFAALGSFGRGAGAGAGMVGPYQPAESKLIVNSAPQSQRNRAFSLVSVASTAGALVGTGLAALLGSDHVTTRFATAIFRPSMLAAALFALASALIGTAIVEAGRERQVTPKSDRQPEAKRPFFALPHKSRWLLYRLWVTNTLNGAAVGMFGPFVTYWLYRRFGASQVTISELYLLVNIVTLASGLIAPAIATRYGTVKATSALRIGQGLLLIPMAMAPTFAIAGAIYMVRMFAQRVALPLRQSYVLAMADPSEQAQVAALSNLPAQIAMALAPSLTGYLFDNVSLVLPFELGGIIQTISSVFYYRFFRHARPPEEREVLNT
jgi:MFS family permease